MSPRKKTIKPSPAQTDVVTPKPIPTSISIPTDTTISRPIGDNTPISTTNSTDFSGSDNANDNSNLARLAQDIDALTEKKTIDRLAKKSSVEKTASMASDATATDSAAISSSVPIGRHESINRGLEQFRHNSNRQQRLKKFS